VVEFLLHHPNIEGSSLAATGEKREKVAKKITQTLVFPNPTLSFIKVTPAQPAVAKQW
jgi:hypothetical protein